jgi:hypothetical protein
VDHNHPTKKASQSTSEQPGNNTGTGSNNNNNNTSRLYQAHTSYNNNPNNNRAGSNPQFMDPITAGAQQHQYRRQFGGNINLAPQLRVNASNNQTSQPISNATIQEYIRQQQQQQMLQQQQQQQRSNAQGDQTGNNSSNYFWNCQRCMQMNDVSQVACGVCGQQRTTPIGRQPGPGTPSAASQMHMNLSNTNALLHNARTFGSSTNTSMVNNFHNGSASALNSVGMNPNFNTGAPLGLQSGGYGGILHNIQNLNSMGLQTYAALHAQQMLQQSGHPHANANNTNNNNNNTPGGEGFQQSSHFDNSRGNHFNPNLNNANNNNKNHPKSNMNNTNTRDGSVHHQNSGSLYHSVHGSLNKLPPQVVKLTETNLERHNILHPPVRRNVGDLIQQQMQFLARLNAKSAQTVQ